MHALSSSCVSLRPILDVLARQPVVDLAAYRAVRDVVVYAPVHASPVEERLAREQALAPFVSALAALIVADLRRGVA